MSETPPIEPPVTPPAEPPATPPSVPPVAQPPVTPPAGEAPPASTLPDNWRELASGGDEKLTNLLKRHGTLASVAKSLADKEDLIRSGKLKRDMPDVKDEKAMGEWRKEQGIPDDPTGYVLSEAITKRLTDDDKPVLSSFTEFAHAKNAPPAFVEMATEWYLQGQEAAVTARAESDKQALEDAEDALRKDWAPGEYKANITLANRFIETIPGLGKDFHLARMPDGRSLGSMPEFVAWASDQGRSAFGDVAFTSTDSEAKHTARKGEIEKIMNTDIDKYYADGLDKEYNTILERETRRKK